MSKVLYITYDGLLEPLGQSQVWQYVSILSEEHSITILSFEKKSDIVNKKKLESFKREVDSYGVEWIPLSYHKRPTLFATMYDVVFGFFYGLYIVKKNKINLIHARSYIPTLIAMMLKKIIGIKYIFDMRGFWADEKVDGGTWGKSSLIYRLVKFLECKFFKNSDAIVSLTNVSKKDIELLECTKQMVHNIHVIPTCVNMKLFSLSNPSIKLPTKKIKFVLGYVGSVDTFYMFDEVLDYFKLLISMLDGKYKLLIINRNQHEYIKEKLLEFDIDEDFVEIKAVDYGDVHKEIDHMNAGIFFYKPLFSKRSTAPTKLGEFLSCGKPCLTNRGVGDTEAILTESNVGVVVSDFESERFSSLENLIKLANDYPSTQSRCRDTAEKYFSLDAGSKKYSQIYFDLRK